MDKDKGMHELDLYNLSVMTTQSTKAIEKDFPTSWIWLYRPVVSASD